MAHVMQSQEITAYMMEKRTVSPICDEIERLMRAQLFEAAEGLLDARENESTTEVIDELREKVAKEKTIQQIFDDIRCKTLDDVQKKYKLAWSEPVDVVYYKLNSLTKGMFRKKKFAHLGRHYEQIAKDIEKALPNVVGGQEDKTLWKMVQGWEMKIVTALAKDFEDEELKLQGGSDCSKYWYNNYYSYHTLTYKDLERGGPTGRQGAMSKTTNTEHRRAIKCYLQAANSMITKIVELRGWNRAWLETRTLQELTEVWMQPSETAAALEQIEAWMKEIAPLEQKWDEKKKNYV